MKLPYAYATVNKLVTILAGIVLIFSQNLLGQGGHEQEGFRLPFERCQNCHSENPSYNDSTEYLDENVFHLKSDFGPRYVVRTSGIQPYDWHGGIDYSPESGDADLGFLLSAIVGGQIYKIRFTGLKYVVIDGEEHDFGYLHLFSYSDNLPMVYGKCRMVELDFPNGLEREKGILSLNGNSINLYVDYDPPSEDRHYYIFNGDTVYAQRNIQEGDFLGALGDSGTGGAHLHLNRYKTLFMDQDFINGDQYLLDPLELVRHRSPNYQIQIKYDSTETINNPDNLNNGLYLKYPGTQRSKSVVRPLMQGEGNGSAYTIGSLNIAEAALKIKHYFSDSFELMSGTSFRSEIFLGATESRDTVYPPYVGSTGVANKGSWNKNGIFHFAYRDPTDGHGTPFSTSGGRPYDDFYFTDFITRIHRDDPMDGGDAMIAYCPMDARYNDGPYELYAEVKNVRDSSFYSDTLAFNLDNWKPFVQQVEFRRGNQLLYRRGWDCKTEEECRGVAISTSLHNQMRHIC